MNDGDNSLGAWVLAGVSTVVAALSSAVAFLFRANNKLYETRIGQLEGEVNVLKDSSEKCQQEHTATKVELAKMNERVAQLEAK